VSKAVTFKLLGWLSIGIIIVNLISYMDLAESKNISSPQEIRAIVEQAQNAWVARDADALAQLFTPDGELIVPGQRWQGQAKIREEVAKFSRLYTDVQITIHRTIVDGNQAVVEWHYEDTETATGKRSQADDAIVIEVNNGRISYWREYFDTSSK
jgi:uncharacterized protein (TIGR02246 family)